MKLLKKPCQNCPFLKVGAIPLRPGRVEGIIANHAIHDATTFPCHKTTSGKQGGEWIEDEEGEEVYAPSGNESPCMGAIAYLTRMGRMPVLARIAIQYRMLTLDEITANYPIIIDPLKVDIQ